MSLPELARLRGQGLVKEGNVTYNEDFTSSFPAATSEDENSDGSEGEKNEDAGLLRTIQENFEKQMDNLKPLSTAKMP